MDQANQGNNPDSPADVTIKRKRGRPRKYPSINQDGDPRVPRDQSLNHLELARVPKERKINHGGNARAPPGFEGMNEPQPCSVEPNGDAVDTMVGQVVSGVVEASFDAGYLLNVRVGNSETTLRGVVFKPGHYVPVSMVNDVAPDVRMIRRNEIPLPTENYTQAHGSHRNGTRYTFSDSTAINQVSRVAPRSSSLVSSKGRHVSSIANPVMSRGNVVPVVLQPMDQPIDVSNGVPLANQPSPVLSQTSLPFSLKGKEVPIVAPQGPHPSNGTQFVNEMQTTGYQGFVSESQTTRQEVPKAVQNVIRAGNGPTQILHGAEINSLEMSGMPMEKLLAEVIKRGQSHSHLAGTGISIGKMDQPLSIEPLQSVQPHQHHHSTSTTRPVEKERIGRMTELLQVVQEKMTENQIPRVEELARSPMPNLVKSQMAGEARDNEAIH